MPREHGSQCLRQLIATDRISGDPGVSRIVYELSFDTVSSLFLNYTPNVCLLFIKIFKCEIDSVSETYIPISKVWDQVVDLSWIQEGFRSRSLQYYEIRRYRKYK